MSDIFLSYTKRDAAVAKALAEALGNDGWTVFWDRNIPVGKRWDQVIETELKDALCVLVLWSKESVDHEWVRLEAEEGLKKNILLPVLIEDDVEPPLRFRLVQSAKVIVDKSEIATIGSHEEYAALLPLINGLAPRKGVFGIWWAQVLTNDRSKKLALLDIRDQQPSGGLYLSAVVYSPDVIKTQLWRSTAASLNAATGEVRFCNEGTTFEVANKFWIGTGRLRFDIQAQECVSGAGVMAELNYADTETDVLRLKLQRCSNEESTVLRGASAPERTALIRRYIDANFSGVW